MLRSEERRFFLRLVAIHHHLHEDFARRRE
jgi:hypothetical protein